MNILLIDDDTTFGKLLCGLLESKGYEVIYTNTILDAEKVITEFNIDFICSDYQMPYGNGFTLFSNETFKNIPICIMTNSEERGLEEKAILLGAVGFLQKTYWNFLDELCSIIDGKKEGYMGKF